jgi:hypothetical protein
LSRPDLLERYLRGALEIHVHASTARNVNVAPDEWCIHMSCDIAATRK